MRDRLDEFQKEAAEKLRKVQAKQKMWYDQKARDCSFESGQKVLLLLPSMNSKLLAKWQGLYIIPRHMGPVTYEVSHPDQNPIIVTEVGDVPNLAHLTTTFVQSCATFVAQLWKLFNNMLSMFSATPRKTLVIEHTICLKESNLI